MKATHTHVLLPLVCLCLVAAHLPTGASDWPQWRGPNRDGISTETTLLSQWPKEGPPLAWKSPGLGNGYSSVAVLGGRIFTIGDQRGSSFVVAINETNGSQAWISKLGKPGAPGWGGFTGPRSTPTVEGNLVYALGQWGELVCLDAATGAERWRKDYHQDFGGSRPEWGFAESPLVDGQNLVITPGGGQGAVVALDKTTGAVIWRSQGFTDAAHYSSPLVADIGGVRQYIQLTAASVVGIAASDGKLLWRAARKGETAVIPSPVYADGLVYVSSGYGAGCNLFKVTGSGNSFSAQQVYANKVMVNHHGGVVKVGNHIYGYSDSKGWTCQDFKTGNAVWQDKSKLGKGSVVAAGKQLYLRQEDKPGTVALIEASPQGYKEHGRFTPPQHSDKQNWAHPVVANGKLYLRENDVLFCYDIQAR